VQVTAKLPQLTQIVDLLRFLLRRLTKFAYFPLIYASVRVQCRFECRAGAELQIVSPNYRSLVE
jgi:hypothetical protein